MTWKAPTAEDWERAPYSGQQQGPKEHHAHCDDDGWDHPGDCVLENLDEVQFFDDGTVTGRDLLFELVGDDELLMTVTSEGIAHELSRPQVRALKRAVQEYERHNGRLG